MERSDKGCTRRGFISAALTGLVSAGVAGLTPGSAFSLEKSGEKKGAKDGIVYRKLGKTGPEIPIVSMGVMNASDPEIVKASFEAGVRHFDTAAYYQYGKNEVMVGSVVKEMGIRDKVVVATKIFTPGQRDSCAADATEETILKLLGESLNRLQMDYVDILYIHNLKETGVASDETIIKAAKKIKKEGRARMIGVSTHTKMAEIINEAVETGVWDVILTTINFTLADDKKLLVAIKNAADSGVGIVAMKTQVGGRRMPDQKSLKKFTSSTIATTALKWVLRNESITTAIPGYTTYEHMQENFSVARDLEYGDEEKKLLLDNEVTVGMGFCRQCEICIGSCPKKVEIPTLMRTHMYAAQYSNFHHARATLDEVPVENGLSACASCGRCRARCAHSVDIPGRIEELKLLYLT